MSLVQKKYKVYPAIIDVKIKKDSIIAEMSDGREISIPIAWFPRLANASRNDLSIFKISSGGYGIHWPKIDEDISIKAFLDL